MSAPQVVSNKLTTEGKCISNAAVLKISLFSLITAGEEKWLNGEKTSN